MLMRNSTEDFGDRVKALRDERKLSQNDLAKEAGISPASFSRILSGERPLRMDQAVALARALGVTVVELTAGTTAEEIVAEWVPRAEYEASDRLRTDAERDLCLARAELQASKAENGSLRDAVRSLTSQVSGLEADLASLQAKAARATALAEKNKELERQVVELKGEVASLSSFKDELEQQSESARNLANLNYQAWVQAKNRVQVLEKSLLSEKSDKVGVAVISAALGALGAAMMASPAETSKRRGRS